MDDDDERRGRPSAHVAYAEGVALLAGDALLAEALRLALSYERPEVALELATPRSGMIGGQYLDITGRDADLAELHRLKTGRLLAAVRRARALGRGPRGGGAGLRGARSARSSGFSSRRSTTCSTATATRAARRGGRARVAQAAARRARTRLDAIEADTSVLAELVDELAVRTA